MSTKCTTKNELLTNAHHDYEKGLNLYAYSRVHSHAIGEDLVQDTFFKTWKYLAKGGKVDMMKAFLYHILKQLIIDEYRKKKTISLDVLLADGNDYSQSVSIENPDVFNISMMVLLINELPEKYKKVMTMKYLEHLSLEDISQATGQTKTTIAVQIHRGITKIKASFVARNQNGGGIQVRAFSKETTSRESQFVE